MLEQKFLTMRNHFGAHFMLEFPLVYFLEMCVSVIAYTFFNQEINYSVHTQQKYTVGFQVIGTTCFLD